MHLPHVEPFSEAESSQNLATLGAAQRNGGVEDSLVRAFDETRAELFGTLYHVLGNQEDAQDVLQAAFLNCWQARSGLANVRNLRSWIWRIALNAAKDLLRNAWRRRAKSLDSAPVSACPQASPPEALLNREKLDRLRAAVRDLRTEEKAVFLLRQSGEMTYEEIAEHRDSPVGTVKSQMRAALHKLRRVLQEGDESELESPVAL